MKTSETMEKLSDKAFLDDLYRWVYHRCNTSHEAEDLCADIVLAILTALNRTPEVTSFYAFAWTIARRTYADFCKRRRQEAQTLVGLEHVENSLPAQENAIDDFVEREADAAQLRAIWREIGFLSNIYREVMVMYYLDGMTVAAIADRLGLSQTAVKQRLFSARRTVKKEVDHMDVRNLSLKPVHFSFLGTGNPVGNDPCEKAERTLSKNLIYLCKDEAKSAKELSEALCVPMPYIEEELEIQCAGENGAYGMLRRLENGKYIANVLVVDKAEVEAASRLYEQQLPALCDGFRRVVEEMREDLCAFPFLSRQEDPAFILWSLVVRTPWRWSRGVSDRLAKRYFADVVEEKRPFTTACIAAKQGESFDKRFYGRDSVHALNVGGFSSVSVENIYGRRMDRHFSCWHNIAQDEKLLLTLRAIGGLPVASLTEDEQEVAAKAIECGYLRRVGEQLEPRILVLNGQDEQRYAAFADRLIAHAEQVLDTVAEQMAAFIKTHIPPHLSGEYRWYNELIASVGLEDSLIEMMIREGLLTEPSARQCAEGVLMVVKK